MDYNFENEFKKTIQQLEQLQAVKAPPSLHTRFENALIPSLTLRKSSSIFVSRLFKVGIASVLFLVVVGGGTIYAAAQSTSGQVIYPLKQALEQVQPFSAIVEKQHVVKADEALSKVEQAAKQKKSDEIKKDVDEYEQEVKQAESDTTTADQQQELQQRLQYHTQTLEKIKEQVPLQAQSAIDHAISASNNNAKSKYNNKNHSLKGGEK